MKKHRILWVLLLALILLVAYGHDVIRRGFSAKDQPSGLEKALAQTMRGMAMPSDAKSDKNPLAASPENIHGGLEHFADHCAICHANNGSGRSDIGENLYPKPPDMRAGETQSLTDGEIYYTIANGVRLSGMPASDHSADDNWRLVLFIRHLPNLTAAEEKEMEHLNASGQDHHEGHDEEEEQGKVPGAPEHRGP